ncbi:Major facilitator superfamily [Ilyonectria robusta]
MEPKSDSQGVKLVDWDGPDDPRHPYNWPKTQRVTHIALVSFITLVVNLAATLFSPAAAKVIVDFSITNTTIASLTVSIYLLGFALGPLVIAPLSELYGRLWIYHICNVVFLAFTIGCATSQNLASFLICRFLAGCAGAAPLTIGGGTIADLVPVEKRGAAMAAYGIGPLLGPVLGPIIGGLVAADLGWRWTLWIISIIVSGLPFSPTMTELFTNHAPGRYSNYSELHLYERDLCTCPTCSNSQKDASRIGRSIATAKWNDQRQAYDTLPTCHYPTYQDPVLLSNSVVSLSFQCFGLRDDVPAVYNVSDSLPTPIRVRHSYFRPQLPWTRKWDADSSLLF